ncbi:HNH endonuclease domain-containing protein [Methanococcus voltae]|uniref:HNH endonuclease domain-containing protein n=1 Tax=Methanococcus voltae TaxID=2188 RepID=UPI001FD9ED3B|nr:HNH endonuclease domain-containing protein [Methanococcus voltae]
MAWAKALVELCVLNTDLKNIKNNQNSTISFTFEEIAELYLKYYWNQTIYFDLVQGSNLTKLPVIIQHVKKLIREYNAIAGNNPKKYEKIDFKALGLEKAYKNTIKKISNVLPENVAWRFKKLNKNTYEIYELDLEKRTVSFKLEDAMILNRYSDLMFQIINYRWTQMLEGFNLSPRISSKVKVCDQPEIKRNSLNKFKKFLDCEFEDEYRYCFYSTEKLSNDLTSIDHVIPWSFMYSDDIWNLVYCNRCINSSKSNKTPTEDTIEKLEDRNILLLKKLENSVYSTSKVTKELNLAIKKDYVRKFWIASKG